MFRRCIRLVCSLLSKCGVRLSVTRRLAFSLVVGEMNCPRIAYKKSQHKDTMGFSCTVVQLIVSHHGGSGM